MSTAQSNSSFDWALVDTAAVPKEVAPGITCGDTITTLAQSILELRAKVEALEAKYETQRLATLEWGKDVENLQRWSDQHLQRIMKLESAQQQAAPVADDDEPQTLHTIALGMVDTLEQLNVLPEILDTLRQAIREPMQHPTSKAAPVATDMDLEFAYGGEDGFLADLRAVYDLGREHGVTCPHIRSSDEGTSYCALAEQTAAAQPAPAAAPAPAGSLVQELAFLIAGFASTSRIGDCAMPTAREVLRKVAEWLREQHDGDLVAATVIEREANQ